MFIDIQPFFIFHFWRGVTVQTQFEWHFRKAMIEYVVSLIIDGKMRSDLRGRENE